MGELVGVIPTLLAEHLPLEALSRWLDRVVQYARVKRRVIAAIDASAWQDLYAGQHGRLDRALAGLLERGRASGELRGDVDATAFILLLGVLSRVPAQEWDARAPIVFSVIGGGLRAR